MNKLTAAHLNFELRFSDMGSPEATRQHWEAGFTALDAALQDNPDVGLIHFAEAAPTLSAGAMDDLAEGMERFGFTEGVATESPRPRDRLVQTMWKHKDISGELDVVRLNENLSLPAYRLPGVLTIFGLHNPSESPAGRLANAQGLVAYKSELHTAELRAGLSEEELTAIGVIADFNEAYPEVTETTRLLHRVDTVARLVPGTQSMDYFKSSSVPGWSKVRKLASAGLRGAAMTRATGLREMAQGGFRDAAIEFNNHAPTVHNGRFSMPIDHSLLAGERVRFADHKVVPIAYGEDGKRITDHSMNITTFTWDSQEAVDLPMAA